MGNSSKLNSKSWNQSADPFMNLSIEPSSENSREFIEKIVEDIAEYRVLSEPNSRKQRVGAINQQKYIIGRILGNFVYEMRKNSFIGYFVPVSNRMRLRKDNLNDKDFISFMKFLLVIFFNII